MALTNSLGRGRLLSFCRVHLRLRALPCRSPGFAPEAEVSAYLKLLPMLAGIGSPGTMQEVVVSSPLTPPFPSRRCLQVC